MINPLRKFRHQKRRLFFPVGMLSLCLLPLFGFSALFSDQYFHEVHVLPLFYASKEMEDYARPQIEKTNAQVIVLKGTPAERKIQIKNFNRDVELIQKIRPDSFIFNISLEHATMNDLVSLIEISKKNKMVHFVSADNHFWTWSGHKISFWKNEVKQRKMPCAGITNPKESIIEHGGWCCMLHFPEIPSGKQPHQTLFDIFDQNPHRNIFLGGFFLLLLFNFLSFRVYFNGIKPLATLIK